MRLYFGTDALLIDCTLALAVAVAVLSHDVLELPIVRQRARFTPERA